jgi:hypothetical protein
MEDRGYLVAHPTLVDPKGHAPLEQQHITHKVFLGQEGQFHSVTAWGVLSDVCLLSCGLVRSPW